jgi:hypothetical protein
MNCLACNTVIGDILEVLTCVACNGHYHYECLNITTTEFRANSHTIKREWRCPPCANITSRRKNDNTPVRKPLDSVLMDETNMSVDYRFHDESNQSLLGDTQNSQQRLQTSHSITIEQISALLDLKLQNNNIKIVNDMKSIIQAEVSTAINQLKHEFTQKNLTILGQQELLAQQLQDTTQKINILQEENQAVKAQLHELQTHLNQTMNVNCNDNYKKFVLYGLDEHYGENESDICFRLNNMFQELLNVNINGFIESVERLGKRGNRRPLVVELISKRMNRYIINNANCFRNTGYAISEVLDRQALRNRQNLRNCLRSARDNGKHAVIRNNRLFINGKEFVPTQEQEQPQEQTSASRQNSTQHPEVDQTIPNTESSARKNNGSENNHGTTSGINHLFRV